MCQANLQLCMFHVPRNCRREVSVEKLGISVGEKIRALEILQDIVYSKSDEQYKLHYNKLCNDCSNAVISYYNWHNIRKEWVDGLKDGVNLGNRTNNRIESINDKVKSVLKHHSTLPEFAENFLIALKSLRTERDLKTVGMFQKKAVAPYPKESPEYKYRKLVTPYAWSFIQLMQKSEVTIEEHEGDDGESLWSCQTAQGKVAVNMNSYTCSFYKSMPLPSRHVLEFREIKGEDLFSNDL